MVSFWVHQRMSEGMIGAIMLPEFYSGTVLVAALYTPIT